MTFYDENRQTIEERDNAPPDDPEEDAPYGISPGPGACCPDWPSCKHNPYWRGRKIARPWIESTGFIGAGQSVGCGACGTPTLGPARYYVIIWDTEDGRIGQTFCSASCANRAIRAAIPREDSPPCPGCGGPLLNLGYYRDNPVLAYLIGPELKGVSHLCPMCGYQEDVR